MRYAFSMLMHHEDTSDTREVCRVEPLAVR